MSLYKLTTKKSGTFNGQKIEKGMSVEVVHPQKPMGFTKGKEAIITAFKSKYGVDVSRILTTSFLDEEKLS
jgi:hypothetical protein